MRLDRGRVRAAGGVETASVIVIGFTLGGQFGGEVQREQFLVPALKGAQALPQRVEAALRLAARFERRQLPDGTPILLKNKGYLRVSQGGERQIMLHVARFRFFSAQEFPAGRQV